MKTLNEDINQALYHLISKINDKSLSRRKIDKLLRNFAEDLKVPFAQFKKRMDTLAEDHIRRGSEITLNKLIGLNKEAILKNITAKDVEKLVKLVNDKDFVFTRWKTKEKKDFIYETYNISGLIKQLEKNTGEDIGKRIKGSVLAGDTANQMIAKLSDRKLDKKRRRAIKLVYETVKYRARTEANLATMAKNEKYYDYIKLQTSEDEKVTETCQQLSIESVKKKYKASELPKYFHTPVHFNCRCSLVPIVGEDAGLDKNPYYKTVFVKELPAYLKQPMKKEILSDKNHPLYNKVLNISHVKKVKGGWEYRVRGD